jgi:hypothetical protein
MAAMAGEHVQVLGHLLEAARVAADQDRGQALDDVGQAGAAETFVEFGPADDAVAGGDFQE